MRFTFQLPKSCWCVWISCLEPVGKIGQSRESAPNDGGSRRWVVLAIKVSAQTSDGSHVECEIPRCVLSVCRHCSVEQEAFGFGEDSCRGGRWALTAEHGQPRDPSSDDTAKRDVLGKGIRRGQSDITQSGNVNRMCWNDAPQAESQWDGDGAYSWHIAMSSGEGGNDPSTHLAK